MRACVASHSSPAAVAEVTASSPTSWMIDVVAGAAVERVDAGTADEHVVAGAAEQDVVAVAADEHVVARRRRRA